MLRPLTVYRCRTYWGRLHTLHMLLSVSAVAGRGRVRWYSSSSRFFLILMSSTAEDDPVLAKLVSAQFCILQSVFFQCFCIERMCCVVMNSLINKSYEYHYLIRHCSNPHLLLLFVIFYFNLFIAVFYTGPRDPRGSCWDRGEGC